MDDEEPTLPKLPAVSWDSHTQTFTNTRKRARDQSLAPPVYANSSDPAVFSSDDDPHVENYTQGRHRKKRYVGSWFQQHLASSDLTFPEVVRPLPKAKRTFERQFDSGVWMGSDVSVDADDDAITEMDLPASSKLPQLRHIRPVPAISPSETIARQVIQDAIDTGSTAIDLSSSQIDSISNATISQLSMLDTVPPIAEDFPFQPKEPSISLYLSNNPLSRAPGAIFNLENLTILTLRNTNITELPPSIGKLRNLQTLNISLTRLRSLPGELLDLLRFPSKLEILNIHPNPFYQPDSLESDFVTDDTWNEVRHEQAVLFQDELVRTDGRRVRFWLDKQCDPSVQPEALASKRLHGSLWGVVALARTPVQFSDSRGVVVSTYKLPNLKSTTADSPIYENLEHPYQVIQTEDLYLSPELPRLRRNQSASICDQSRVPSLLELALLSCLRSGQLRELPSYLPSNAPPHFMELLYRLADRSEQNANSGDLPCSVCGRRVAVHLTEWIEWWEISRLDVDEKANDMSVDCVGLGDDERAIPFSMRGCSWKCLPKAMKPGQRRRVTIRWGSEPRK
ncbi:hypothetical protein F4813DRAFT_44854 [Daldinia decipiens]|uniref:uncharacterized protein n=1 Tax=Daldinia decipiens TaxID=326647 RepID=UPI0020C1C58C|nr:uncharacterized protein F4813DRAFT_44854 [Daldinia decipiens]KAI1658802.1 hypothetical protein F4813DRAFT_44854 [Daldinia decipiens]